MSKLQLTLNNAQSDLVSMVWVSIRVPRILLGDVFFGNHHAADVYLRYPGKSQYGSRCKSPSGHRYVCDELIHTPGMQVSVTCKLTNFLSALQTCSCTLSVMMNSPLCCLALLWYCRSGSVRNVAGALSLSSPSPL